MPQAVLSSPILRLASLVTSLLLLLTTGVSAQSADTILKKAAKAMGGEKAIRRIKSREMRGVITRLNDQTTGSYRMMTTRPNFLSIAFDVGGFEVSAGYNGKSGWMRDSRDGLRTLTGATSRDFQAEASFRNSFWLDYKRDKSKVRNGGPATEGGRQTKTVLLTTSRNAVIRMFFDASTNVLVREEMMGGEAARTFEYSDHRLINGVMEPHSIVAAIGGEKYEIKINEVNHGAVFAQTAFDFPKVSSEPLPDITALVKDVGDNEEAIDRLLENYTFTEYVSTRSFDKGGKLVEKESQTLERTYYKGNRIQRLIAKNGKPLSEEEQAKVDKDVEKRIREIEKKEAEQSEKVRKAQAQADKNDTSEEQEGNRRVSIADLLRASKLGNPRRERFRNRDVIVFDFEPMAGYKPKKNHEKLFGKMAGVLWVDTADKQVARVEARLVEAYKIAGGLLASLREGATIVIEQDRVNNEVWLPTRLDIALTVRVLVVKNFDTFLTVDYGNYKRFNVDAEKEKLSAPVTNEKKPDRF